MKSLTAEPIAIKWQPCLPIFASEQFLKAVGDEYGWLGGFDDSRLMRCILPFTVVHKPGFRMVRFRVETVPVVPDFDVCEERAFLDSAVSYFRALGADMIIPATTNSVFRCYPAGAIAAPYGTYVVHLQQPEEKLWSSIHKYNRGDILGAMKRGVKIQTGIEYLDAAYAQVRDTFKRSGMSFMDLSAFRRMVKSVGENAKIFVSEYHGVMQSCVVSFYSNHSVYCVYGGSMPKPENGANKLLHWHAMQLFRNLGVARYDFVGARIDPEKGSKQENLMLYKRRLGGQLIQGYMWKYCLRPAKFAVYSLAVRMLRGGDIVDCERHKMPAEKSEAVM